ncbi:MAG: peptidylprolyl isomerase [Treponema sp.]|nr:peptidylprolyl isomerase [Candidatus Treponema merdequi]
MKKGFYSIGSIIILLLAAIIFVLVPALAGVEGGTKFPDYGSYNGKPIRYEENSPFYNAAIRIIEDYESKGVNFNEKSFANYFYAQAFEQAFTNVIGSYALTYFSETTGYKVTKPSIDRRIRQMSQFKDVSNEFSPAIYESLSEQDKKDLRKSIAEELIQLRCYEDIFGSLSEIGDKSIYGLKTSTAELDFINKMSEKLYSFDAAAFDMSTYPDSEKVAFGNSHKDLFVKYNLKVISCDTEAKAKEVLKRIKNSEITFEDAVGEYSTKHYGDQETGMLSANFRYQLDNAFSKPEDIEKVISLPVDSLSDVIETPSAYCIFKTTEAPVQPDFTNDFTVSNVYDYLRTREKSVIENYFENQAKDFVAKANTAGFENACNAFPVKTNSYPAFALNYNNTSLIGHSPLADDSLLSTAITTDELYKTAFKLKKDEISSPLILSGSNVVLVLRCSDITTAVKTADDVKACANEVNMAAKSSINSTILASDKIKDNSQEFMKVFLSTIFGNKS